MEKGISKDNILALCLSKIEDKIHRLQEEISGLQKAKEEETKSSAGDKYETGMAMIQLEEAKLNRQLEQARKENQVLLQIQDPGPAGLPKSLGRLYHTSSGVFFTAIGLGAISIDGTSVFVLSPGSPMGQLLAQQSEGSSFQFNGKSFQVNICE
ncbi:hypothetical protein KFE98_07770 [bacterium SCSIO 12741]|nr:hypothetical protein KFE98_07770 [bacterium SCSIO 12741]